MLSGVVVVVGAVVVVARAVVVVARLVVACVVVVRPVVRPVSPGALVVVVAGILGWLVVVWGGGTRRRDNYREGPGRGRRRGRRQPLFWLVKEPGCGRRM